MSTESTRIVITGLGAVSPNGVGIPAFTAALRAGKSGIRSLPFTHEKIKSTCAAMVTPDIFDPALIMSQADVKRLPRLVPMALAAAREAMSMAQLGPFDAQDDKDHSSMLDTSRRTGLILGTGGGGIDFTIEQFAAASLGKTPSLWTITNATHGNLAGELSIRLGLRGPSHCISTGCTSSSDAFGTAMLHLQAGRVDAMVVGGADAHVHGKTLWMMELLGVLSTRKWETPLQASRPFDNDRDGFILGEGAWFAVLETEEAAQRRGANVLAELLGYGSTCDAYHRVRPDPEPVEAARAIHLALEQAQLSPDDIEYVQYHGTGTQLNDVVETHAIKAALGQHARDIPGSSIKSMIGHPQGACGAAALVGTIASLRAMDSGNGPFLPPTINLETADPECDLDYVPLTARPTHARTALVNCLAFGAKNSALVIRVV